MQIKLNVSEHLLTLAGTSMLAGGSENVDTIKVTFDSTWNGFGKLAVFNTEKTDSTNVAIDTDGIATIPSLKSKKYLRIGIVGIKNEQTYTTNVIKLYVEDGAVKSESEAPADDVYHQILSMFGEMTTKIEKLTTNLNCATMIAEGKTEYGGGFRLYSLGNLLLIKHIPGALATGSTSDKKTLFEYGEQYPAVSEDEDRKLPNGITLTLTTDRKVKYSTTDTITPGNYWVESGIDIFMTNADVDPIFNPIITVVTELPTTNINSNTMYFLKKSDGTFEQYMYVENSWVKIGGDYSDGNGVSY